jgi:hypothetical protein
MLTLTSTSEFVLVTASGELSTPELIDAYRRFLDEGSANLLWDLSSATLVRISSRELTELAVTFGRIAHGRRIPGRTAAVCPQSLEYGLARMFAVLLGDERHPAQVGVFRRLDEAKAWLTERPAQPNITRSADQ